MTNFSPIPAPPSASEPPSEGFDALLHALRRQAELFEQLNELASQQAPLIEQGEGPVLLELLAARQRVVDDLLAAEDQVREQAAMSPRFSAAQRSFVADVMTRIRQLRHDLAKTDDRDQARLREVQARLSMEMSRVTQAGQAAKAYGAASAPRPANDFAAWVNERTTSRFTDHQG